jgi:type I restriction enzyme S subunit
MSNNMVEADMTPAIKRTLVPKLRFPEFRDAGEWETKELSELAVIINEKAGCNKYTLMSISSGIGLVSQLEKFGREIAGAQYKNYIVIRKNDFAYNKSATKEYPEGFIAIYSGTTPAAVPNSVFTCFRVDECKVLPEYLCYLFFCNLHGRWLKNFITMGARAHGSLNIDNSNLLALPVPLPTGYSSLAEQRKIAKCLSSIDELISLEAQKLDALKAHKKGLMQQLFPTEGETLPKLRFPEFRDAGEWFNEPMEELYTFKGTNSLSREKLNYEIGSVKNIHYGDIHTKFSTHFEIQNEVVPYINPSEPLYNVKPESYCVEGDMIFADASEDTKDIGKCIEVIMLNNERLLSGLHTILARPKGKRLIIGFGGHLFRSDSIRKQIQNESQGTKVLGLSTVRLSKIKICYPKNKAEQQKIADCLSSIDDLIALQIKKLDSLKVHKKGLMQQLFPSPGEVRE